MEGAAPGPTTTRHLQLRDRQKPWVQEAQVLFQESRSPRDGRPYVPGSGKAAWGTSPHPASGTFYHGGGEEQVQGTP